MPTVASRIIRHTAVPLIRAIERRWMDGGTLPGDLAAFRADAERWACRLSHVPRATRIDRLVLDGVPVERVSSPGADRSRAVLYLHGGGYVVFSPLSHRALAAAVSRSVGAPVWVPDYRLAPEHPYPAALDDAVGAYGALLDRGLDPARLAVVGDSAGGGLAVALLVHLRDDGVPAPACAVLLSPWTDLTRRSPAVRERAQRDPLLNPRYLVAPAEAYAAGRPLDHPDLSPVYADLAGLPPLLVHAGTDEILFDDARRLVAAVQAAGGTADLGVWQGMWHVFHAFPVPEARRALREIGGFVRRHTGAGAVTAR